MMRSLLLIFLTLYLYSTAGAQTADSTTAKPKITAAKRAAQQLKRLEKQLHLTQDQVLQLQVILINRDVAMDSLRKNSPGGPPSSRPGHPSDLRPSDNRARRRIQQDADDQINALLTDEQKPLYEQWKQQQRTKNKARQAAKNDTPPSTQPQNPSSQPG
jgi:hypothetical protein